MERIAFSGSDSHVNSFGMPVFLQIIAEIVSEHGWRRYHIGQMLLLCDLFGKGTERLLLRVRNQALIQLNLKCLVDQICRNHNRGKCSDQHNLLLVPMLL